MRKQIFKRIKYLNLESFSFGSCGVQVFPKINKKVDVSIEKDSVYFKDNGSVVLCFQLDKVESLFRSKKVMVVRFKDNTSMYLYLGEV